MIYCCLYSVVQSSIVEILSLVASEILRLYPGPKVGEIQHIRAHKTLQKEPCSRIRHEGYGVDALFSMIGSVAEEWGDLPWSREICDRYSEEIQNAGLSTYGDTHHHQLEEDRCIRGQGSQPHLVQTSHWVAHVSGQH